MNSINQFGNFNKILDAQIELKVNNANKNLLEKMKSVMAHLKVPSFCGVCFFTAEKNDSLKSNQGLSVSPVPMKMIEKEERKEQTPLSIELKTLTDRTQELCGEVSLLSSDLRNLYELLYKVISHFEELKIKQLELSAINNLTEEEEDAYGIIRQEVLLMEITHTTIQKELAKFIHRSYKPNTEIPNDGNCFFWSCLEAQHLRKKDPRNYRHLIANYMTDHKEEVREAIEDAFMLDEQFTSRYKKFIVKFYKTDEFFDQALQKKLGREPDNIDRYSECLSNSNLWVGLVEVKILSQILQQPIFVFQPSYRGDGWETLINCEIKLFLEEGKNPILIYFNGSNHYQNLIPRKA